MSDGGNRKRLIPVALGGVAVLLIAGYFLWSRSGRYETVDPASQFALPAPGFQLEEGKPVPKPSLALVQEIADPGGVPTPVPIPTLSEADQLSAIMANWVYRGFVGLGDQKTGRFTRYVPEDRDTVQFFLREGEVLDGVTIEKMDVLSAIGRLGEATISLPLVPERRPSLEQIANPAIPSKEEVVAAQTAYWENYGKRFAEMGKRYTPRPGERMPPPQPPSPEEIEEAKKNYLATYAPLFEAQQAARTPVPGEVMPQPQDPLDEQEAIKRYYERFRPWATPPVTETE